MSRTFRRRYAAAALFACAPTLAAQGPPSATAPVPAANSSARCSIGHAALRATVGGVLGAWVGLVVGKIQNSDWNDATHTSQGHRALTRATLTGAAVGAAVGSLLHVGGGCGGPAGVPQRTRLGREPITRDEIDRSGQTGNVYDLVYATRRSWLNLRGTEALTEGPETLNLEGGSITLAGTPHLSVYLDNARLGSVDELKTIPISSIVAVRFYDPAEATLRWGAGNTHGVIQALTSDIP